MKRKTAALIGLIAIGACASATILLDKGPDTGDLVVEVVGFESTEGSLRAAIFGEPTGFPSDPATAHRVESLPIADTTLTWEVGSLATGMWAIAVLHDEDGDGEVDTDWMGRPSEGWGVSNDARGSFGPPSFADAAFEVTPGENRITIRVSY